MCELDVLHAEHEEAAYSLFLMVRTVERDEMMTFRN